MIRLNKVGDQDLNAWYQADYQTDDQVGYQGPLLITIQYKQNKQNNTGQDRGGCGGRL